MTESPDNAATGQGRCLGLFSKKTVMGLAGVWISWWKCYLKYKTVKPEFQINGEFRSA